MVEGDPREPDAGRDLVADGVARLLPVLGRDDRRTTARRLVDVDAVEGEAERGDGGRRGSLPAGAEEGSEAGEQRAALRRRGDGGGGRLPRAEREWKRVVWERVWKDVEITAVAVTEQTQTKHN